MEFKKILERVLGNEEDVSLLKILSIKESSCTRPGQNFMSVVSLVHIDGELPNGDPYKKSVFIKRPTNSVDHNIPGSIADAFTNEVLMYQEVLPLIAGGDATSVGCPRFYHASSDVIVLEDLRVQGYRMGDVAGEFDLATAQSVLKALARFHAVSYHTSVIQKGTFYETVRHLKPLGLIVSSYKSIMDTSLQRAIRYLEAEDYLKTAATSLRKLQGRVTEKMKELQKPKNIAVLVHGDFWFNNILTHKNNRSDENEIRIIDFQACAFLSPAVDFWLFLYTSISPSLLENNCDSFIQLYSSEFIKVLSDRKASAEQYMIPSAASLKDELLSKELYGFLTAMAYLQALYLKPEMLSEIGKITEEEKNEDGLLDRFVGSQFKERLNEVARYCKRKGVL